MIRRRARKLVESLDELFEEQVRATPEALALIDGDSELSYLELDRLANQFACHLRSAGIGREDFVGLFCRRSADAIISMLGILKAGAAYVPLDELWPDNRIESILADAEVRYLVTDKALVRRARATATAQILVHDDRATRKIIRAWPTQRLESEESGSCGEALCYIIYTSGTTGRPKGIMTEHRNVVAFANAFRKICEMTPRDRVYQGFSLTFDGSVEEIWMAFSSGATLVIGPPQLARLGEETAEYMREKAVTFFSTVPTFLDMIKQDVPSLRLVIVSGEHCPPSLVKRWVRPGLRMLNVYGPTETTVNTTAWDCVPESPIRIGKPLPGYTTYILDENRQPVPFGGSGELYIGGVGVARGYLNQPDLSERTFVHNPFDDSATLYRTGDLVQETDNGELILHGRIDGQVKVRGYRIELGEIEAGLREHPAVSAAVVTVLERTSTQELAAYVVPHTGNSAEMPRREILDSLRQRLPSYMVPTYLEEIPELPRLTSGKVDRKALPPPSTRVVGTQREIVPPQTETERIIVAAWERVFQMSPISIDEDFFLDLGGDSLLAVETAMELRKSLNADIGVRDIYRWPTVRQLAEHVTSLSTGKSDVEAKTVTRGRTAEEVFTEQSTWVRRISITLQSVSLYVLYGIPMVIVVGLVELYFGVMSEKVSPAFASFAVAALFIGGYPLLLGFSILAKWIIVGRYQPGSYPLWGWYYFRWWFVTRFYRMSGVGLLAGTPLINIYLRLMGARIGRGCVINTAHCTSFDLLAVGDHTCIGNETQLLGYRVADGMLTIGPTTLGKNCYVGFQSAIGLHTEMGDGSLLDDLSLLSDGEKIPPGEMRQGSPSQPGRVTVPTIPKGPDGNRRSFVFGMLSILGVYAVQLFMLAASLPTLVLLCVAYTVQDYWLWGAVLLLAIPLFEICFWTLQILVRACVLRRAKPGVYPVDSVYFLRKWYVDTLLSMSRLFTLPIYTTLYLPPLLRMLGARIGARAELSVIVYLSPDLVVMEDESFFADGSIIGGLRIHQGHFELAVNRIGRRSFLGNSAVLPVGKRIGRECLLGVLSSPPRGKDSIPDESEWLGAPSFALPHRKRIKGFSEAQTYKPPAKLYVARLCVDALRIATSGAIEVLGVIIVLAAALWAHGNLPLGALFAVAPLAGMATAVLMVLCVVGVKRALFDQFRPVVKPLWSPYVWFNEVVNGAHESVAAPMLSPLLGTPFFAVYLRMMGCKIGRYSFIDTTLFGEFDLLKIGDHAALNYDVVLQNHLFEDRIFKSSRLVIGNNCSVGNMSVVLYDSEMGDGSSLASLSLVMKGEALPPHSHWEGIPVRRIFQQEMQKNFSKTEVPR